MGDGLAWAVGVGLVALAAVAFAVARVYGMLAGLVLPALAAGAALVAASMPVGHPEEVMGRGLAQMFLWLPLVVAALVGTGLGLIARRKAARRGAG